MMDKDIENKSDMSWDEYERWRAQMIVNNSIQESGYMSDDKMKLFMNLATTILMSMLFGRTSLSVQASFSFYGSAPTRTYTCTNFTALNLNTNLASTISVVSFYH